jgi:MFS family permease
MGPSGKGRSLSGGTVGSYFLSYNLYAFGTGLVGVFLNLFFLSNYSFLAVLYFQITTYACELAAYQLSSYLVPKWRAKRLYVLGLALSAFVLADMLAASRMLSSAFFFGALWGIAMGVFFAGNNPMMHDITRDSDRTPFVATNSFLNGVVTLIAPVSAGALVQFSEFSGALRYVWDFAVTAVVLLLSALVILRTRGATDRTMREPDDVARRPPGREFGRFRAYFVSWQLFAIPVGIILPIYVFQVTGSYVVTGFYASYTILVSILANLWWRNGYRREGWFTRGAVLGIIASSALLLLRWDPPLDAFAFAGIYTLLSTPLNNMVTVDFMDLIDRSGDLDRVRVWADREVYLGIGRAAVLAATIAISAYLVRNSMDLIVILPVLTLYALSYLWVLGPRRPSTPVSSRPASAPTAAAR